MTMGAGLDLNLIGGMDAAAFVALQQYQQARLALDRSELELKRFIAENATLPESEMNRRTAELTARINRERLIFDQRKEEAQQATDRWKAKKDKQAQYFAAIGAWDPTAFDESMGDPFKANQNVPDLAAAPAAGTAPTLPGMPGVPTFTPYTPPAPVAALPPPPVPSGGGQRPTDTIPPAGTAWPNRPVTDPITGRFQPPVGGLDPSLLNDTSTSVSYPPGIDPSLLIDRPDEPPPAPTVAPPPGLDPTLWEPSRPRTPPGATLDEDGNIVAMAQGGIVTQPTRALIGEAGPEAVVPLGRSRMNTGWMQRNQQALSGGTPGAVGQTQNPYGGRAIPDSYQAAQQQQGNPYQQAAGDDRAIRRAQQVGDTAWLAGKQQWEANKAQPGGANYRGPNGETAPGQNYGNPYGGGQPAGRLLGQNYRPAVGMPGGEPGMGDWLGGNPYGGQGPNPYAAQLRTTVDPVTGKTMVVDVNGRQMDLAEWQALESRKLLAGTQTGFYNGVETIGGRAQSQAEREAERQWQIQQAQMAANPANYAAMAALRGQASWQQPTRNVAGGPGRVSAFGAEGGWIDGTSGGARNPYAAPLANQVGPQQYDRMRPDERAAFGSAVVAGGQTVGDYEQQLNRQRPNQQRGYTRARWG